VAHSRLDPVERERIIRWFDHVYGLRVVLMLNASAAMTFSHMVSGA
jgi:hypothetical protein